MDLWTKFYCNTSHFRAWRKGAKTHITIQDMTLDGDPFFQVFRLQLDRDIRPSEGAPGGVFTPTHLAYRSSLAEAQAVGEAWSKGDFSAPERL
jgi:hypothetical protein